MLEFVPAAMIPRPLPCVTVPLSASGILNVNKPAGITSRDAVDMVLRLARPAKVGHAGTLDPLATGVLLVCVGSATRLIEYVQRMPKSYTGTFLLGRSSATEDIDGPVTLLVDPPIPSRAQIEDAAGRFVGSLLQRPPVFSALKIAGQRAYDLARRGKTVELTPRPIEVHRLKVVRYDYPELVLEIACGSGTYVRSLGRDLAASLGTAAVMSSLARTAIGPWLIEAAVDPRLLTASDWRSRLEPLRQAVSSLPHCELSTEEISRIRKGLFLSLAVPAEADEVAAIDPRGELVAILVRRGSGQWGAAKNFAIGE
jgi:tRNA pseudouridine55 synthase